jgi:hypothetical protein
MTKSFQRQDQSRLLRQIVCQACSIAQTIATTKPSKPKTPSPTPTLGNRPSGDRPSAVEKTPRWYEKSALKFSATVKLETELPLVALYAKSAPEILQKYRTQVSLALQKTAKAKFEQPTDEMLAELAFGAQYDDDEDDTEEGDDADADEEVDVDCNAEADTGSTAAPDIGQSSSPKSLPYRIRYLINSYCGRNSTARLDRLRRGLIHERKIDFQRTSLPSDKYAFISVDAGIRNVIAACYDVGTAHEKTLILKNRHFKEMSGRGRQQKTYEEALADNPEVQEALTLHQIGETTPESAKCLGDFRRTTRRPLTYQSFRRRQLFYTDLISRLLDPIALRGRTPIVVWGAGKFQSSWKSYVSVPNMAVAKELANRCVVVLADEYRTSQECSACLLFSLQSEKANRGLVDSLCTTNIKLGTCKSNSKRTVKGRQHCETCRLWQPFRRGSTTWNRDENSARSIGIRILYRLQNDGHVPPTLDRGFVFSYRQMKQTDLLARIARDGSLTQARLTAGKILCGKANEKIRKEIVDVFGLATEFMRFLSIGIWRRDLFDEWDQNRSVKSLEKAWSLVDERWRPTIDLDSEVGEEQISPGSETLDHPGKV